MSSASRPTWAALDRAAGALRAEAETDLAMTRAFADVTDADLVEAIARVRAGQAAGIAYAVDDLWGGPDVFGFMTAAELRRYAERTANALRSTGSAWE